MHLDTRNKNIQGKRVGISTVLKIMGTSCFRGGGSRLPLGLMTYIPFHLPKHKDQEYIWFRGGELGMKNVVGQPQMKIKVLKVVTGVVFIHIRDFIKNKT